MEIQVAFPRAHWLGGGNKHKHVTIRADMFRVFIREVLMPSIEHPLVQEFLQVTTVQLSECTAV